MKKYAIISPDAGPDVLQGLMKLDIEPVLIERTPLTAAPLAGHPDLQVFISGNKIFCHPGIGKVFLEKVGSLLEPIICGTALARNYPCDIPYNIADTGPTALHNLKYSDHTVVKYLKNIGKKLIHVKQGYTKCSTVTVNENAVITADSAIHNACVKESIDSLKITPGYVDLPGYPHGFMGGATGNDGGRIFFTGDFSHHPDCAKIMEFIEKKGCSAVILSGEKITDLGSILIFEA